ncbi:hypothetical protein [Faecalibacter bovis]|uniref:Uncharacterized protein n=1 Tax=Faecalibacter bovis TaxID=2898187 RepID=A0ABX7XDS4_9FLAO|nr:hypothetical protein [Faecalibacter bovis]QTV06040.1 hypothetical protein J9309_01445 [Faecalibacter bovis]
MNIFKKISKKIDSFLINQIDKQDEILKKQQLEKKEIKLNDKNLNINVSYTPNPNKSIDLGLYFMDISKELSRSNKGKSELAFYLGLATQGRLDEAGNIIDLIDHYNSEYLEFIERFKKDINSINRTSLLIHEKGIDTSLKNNETIGQYYSRKLSQNKSFIEKFNTIKDEFEKL